MVMERNVHWCVCGHPCYLTLILDSCAGQYLSCRLSILIAVNKCTSSTESQLITVTCLSDILRKLAVGTCVLRWSSRLLKIFIVFHWQLEEELITWMMPFLRHLHK